MTKFSKFALFALLGAVGATSAFAAGTTAATVNGVAIPQERVDFLVNNAVANQQKDTPELHKAVLDRLTELELVSQEAVRLGLDKNSDTRQELDISRQNVLANALMQDRAKNAVVTEGALRSEYDDMKNDVGAKEYDVRHILVGSKEEADKLIAKLKKTPGDFDKLAKSESKDAGSKEHGGQLGWIPANKVSSAFVKPFADAVMGLSKGQLSEPVQSQFGWHVIKLQDVRDIKFPSFEELKPQLTQRLQVKAAQSYLTDLRSKAKIVQ